MESVKTKIVLKGKYAYKISEIRHPNAVILEVGTGIFMTFFTDSDAIEHIHITDLAYLTLELEHAESSQPPIE